MNIRKFIEVDLRALGLDCRLGRPYSTAWPGGPEYVEFFTRNPKSGECVYFETAEEALVHLRDMIVAYAKEVITREGHYEGRWVAIWRINPEVAWFKGKYRAYARLVVTQD